MATKKEKAAKEATKKENKMTEEEKAAKRAARKEAMKNRPAVQRPNSKQIDIIEGENYTVKNFGYPVKSKKDHVGVVVTSVIEDKKGNPVSTSVTFVPGKLTVKSKKNHGIICSPKSKKEEDDAENEEED